MRILLASVVLLGLTACQAPEKFQVAPGIDDGERFGPDPELDGAGWAVGAIVPAIWHLEVANALLVGERRGRCEQADTSSWTAFLSSLPIAVDEHSGARVLGDVLALARAQNLSAYDAAYLELALRRGLPLATLDKRLKTAAAAVGVEFFQPKAQVN